VGLTGEPNTASLIDKTALGQGTGQSILTGASVTTLKVWIKKDTDQTRFPLAHIKNAAGVFLNTQTGHVWGTSAVAPVAVESIDAGDWWIALAEITTAGASLEFRAWAAAQSVEDDGTVDSSVTGSAIFGNYEVYPNKTIPEVRGLGPIFTVASAVATDVTVYTWDNSNYENLSSAWFVEENSDWNSSPNSAYHTLGAVAPSASSMFKIDTRDDGANTTQIGTSYINTSAGSEFPGFFDPPGFTHGVTSKMALNYNDTDAKLNISVNNVWDTERVNFANMVVASQALEFAGRGVNGSAKLRNLQRYDIASYAAGVTIIDDLMA
jgi:hypothetical protein